MSSRLRNPYLYALLVIVGLLALPAAVFAAPAPAGKNPVLQLPGASQTPEPTTVGATQSTATPAPGAETAAGTVTLRFTTLRGAGLYRGPGLDYPQLAFAAPGLDFRVLAASANGEWFLVGLGAQASGWLTHLDGELSGDPGGLPQATAEASWLPSPTPEEPGGIWVSAVPVYSDKKGIETAVLVTIHNVERMQTFVIAIFDAQGKEVFSSNRFNTRHSKDMYESCPIGKVREGTYRVRVGEYPTGPVFETTVYIRSK